MPDANELRRRYHEKIKRYVDCPRCEAKAGAACRVSSEPHDLCAWPLEYQTIRGLHKERHAAWHTAWPLAQLADCAEDDE